VGEKGFTAAISLSYRAKPRQERHPWQPALDQSHQRLGVACLLITRFPSREEAGFLLPRAFRWILLPAE